MHVTPGLKVLYFGTPVVLISSRNEDGSANLAPMSSAWWLGQCCMLGLGNQGQTRANLGCSRPCAPSRVQSYLSDPLRGFGCRGHRVPRGSASDPCRREPGRPGHTLCRPAPLGSANHEVLRVLRRRPQYLPLPTRRRPEHAAPPPCRARSRVKTAAWQRSQTSVSMASRGPHPARCGCGPWNGTRRRLCRLAYLGRSGRHSPVLRCRGSFRHSFRSSRT